MQFVFRTDSSRLIGTGHLMRCLTLADRLKADGHTCLFVCRELPGHVSHLVENRGHELRLLTEASHPEGDSSYAAWLAVSRDTDAKETLAAMSGNADWLVVDHYGIDRAWEKQLRAKAARIMVIDDLANRPHDCGVITEQNFRSNAATRYDGLVSNECLQWVGPQFALIRPEFVALRKSCETRTSPNRLLVFYGGVDASNETAAAIEAVRLLNYEFKQIDIVIGEVNPHRDAITAQAAQLPNAEVHSPAKDIASLMAAADLALGAGGVTAWERCTLGLPTIITAVADNQVDIAKGIASQRAGWYAGEAADVSAESLAFHIEEILLGRRGLSEVSDNARALCDGGGAERICDGLVRLAKSQRVKV